MWKGLNVMAETKEKWLKLQQCMKLMKYKNVYDVQDVKSKYIREDEIANSLANWYLKVP